MNALALYVSTCRLVLQAQDDADTWTEVGRLLPQLRKALSCAVCTNIVSDPMTPNLRLCFHTVCRECLGKKVRPRSLCNVCKDHVKFVENKQFRTLLLCFRKLCEYIVRCSYRKLESIESGTNLAHLLLESIGIKEFAVDQGNNHGENGNISLNAEQNSELPTNGDASSAYSVMFANDHRTKITIKRKPMVSPSSSHSGNFEKVFKRQRASESAKAKLSRSRLSLRKECRCGNATPTPGKLTCCGQRCPCYVRGKGCTECKCRGCRNPHKISKASLNVRQEQIAATVSADEKTTDTGSDVDIF